MEDAGLGDVQLQPASMAVYINRLSHKINRRVAFNYLDTTSRSLASYKLPADFPPELRRKFLFHPRKQLNKQEIKQIARYMPECTIISLSDSGATRGITASTMPARHGSFLKNNTMFTICMKRGDTMVPMHANLSIPTIHVCGAKNTEEVGTVCNFILDHIKDLQRRLDYIQGLPEALRMSTLRATEIYRGPEATGFYMELVVITVKSHLWKRATKVRKDETTEIELDVAYSHQDDMNETGVKVLVKKVKWLLQQPDVIVKRNRRSGTMTISFERPMKHIPQRVTKHMLLPRIDVLHLPAGLVDPVLFETMTRNKGDFDSFENWYACCKLLLQETFCCEFATELRLRQSSLVNSNLVLPFTVCLNSMARFMKEEQLAVTFNNEHDGYVSLLLAYVPDDTICRKNDDDGVEVMVYSSGKTIFSGPSLIINQQACAKFLPLMKKFKSQ